ncbi:MAG: phosphotyrosine protein phosphatase [Pseudomonadota bacterium]
MSRVLFLCGEGRTLSPTAAQLFAEKGLSTDFAGVSPGIDDALTQDQLDWADLIVVMERRHHTRLNERFGRLLAGKKILTLDIRDRFTFMEPALIAELLEKAGPRLTHRDR